MNRVQKAKRIEEQNGRALSVRAVNISENYLNSSYQLKIHDPAIRSTTGELRIFELASLSALDPLFVARWDGGSRVEGKPDKQDLDVDIHNVSWYQKHQFKKARAGYSGHHCQRIADASGRAYAVQISTPSGRVFEGTVKFKVQFGLACGVSTAPVASVATQLSSKRLWSRISSWLLTRLS